MIPVRVGNSILDHDHAGLSCLLEDLHALWINRCGLQAALHSLIRFEDALCAHFAIEETILAGCAYTGLPQHQIQHRTFLTEVATLRRALAGLDSPNGQGPLHTFDIASRLSDLLYAHELVEDSAYIPALALLPDPPQERSRQTLSTLMTEVTQLKTASQPPLHPADAPPLTPQAPHALTRLAQYVADGSLKPEQVAADFLPYWLERLKVCC